MIIKDVIAFLEELAPLKYAEDFDNVGLLLGNSSTEVSDVLVTLDTLEIVVEEAITKKCNLIVSFHPIIFEGLKKITGATYVERVVLKAIKHNIAIYCMHTALDNVPAGVNAKICEVLEIMQPKILIPKQGSIKKLTTYVPKSDADELRTVLFKSGAGTIGDYSNCSFSVDGTGSFKPGELSNPIKGKKGNIHFEEETQIHITYEAAKEVNILKALFNNHPYEEVAYELYTLENDNQKIGMGMIGTLKKELDEEELLQMLKTRMYAKGIRHSKLLGKKVKKVAVLGGSGAFAIKAAISAGADMLVTSDIKYHQFYLAEEKLVVADIGHYESEQFTKNLLVDYLTKKMPNFAISLSESKTNPINYF